MFRRERRAPCKLNNVTKRKHQKRAHLDEFAKGQSRLTGLSQLPVGWRNEAMTNSSMKFERTTVRLDTIL